MKKTFPNPFIMLTEAELNDIGGGSLPGGLDSIKPIPLSFDEWTQSKWCTDSDGSGGVDYADYVDWWSKSGFSTDAWTQYNPDVELEVDVTD